MFGDSEIYAALNISAITGLLDAWGTGKALWNEPLIPENFTGHKSINYYLIAPVNGASEVEQYEYNVNCRAAVFGTSLTIAKAVFDALNRVSGTDYYITCQVLQTIPPADDRDNYNTPVSIKIKMR